MKGCEFRVMHAVRYGLILENDYNGSDFASSYGYILFN